MKIENVQYFDGNMPSKWPFKVSHLEKTIGREDAKQEIIWELSAVFSAIAMLLFA
ncbi:hypothetical protein [Hoylesella buccalis]|uniref:hypothetical protein n=1 Tax=Hoylesella buccalis TaxID=28127 RepID=UPI0039945057